MRCTGSWPRAGEGANASQQVRLTVGNYTEHERKFYTGRPIWKVDGVKHTKHPEGYQNCVDIATGALKWTHEEVGDVWDTGVFWDSES